MPGSVANAAPATVLPYTLARDFVAGREYLANQNSYRGGERQVGLLVATSRKTFEFTGVMNAADLATMRTFYLASQIAPFYFYYGPETSPPYSYDATGAATTGRYTVVVESLWEQSVGLGRSEVAIRLKEVN